MPRKTIPHFASDEEAAEFWDTHDFTEYMHDTEPAPDARFRLLYLKKVTLRLYSWQITALKRRGAARGVGYQTLLRE